MTEPSELGPCGWYTNPFALTESEGTGQCGKPGKPARFRRKTDGVFSLGFCCDEHDGLCNDQWELVR